MKAAPAVAPAAGGGVECVPLEVVGVPGGGWWGRGPMLVGSTRGPPAPAPRAGSKLGACACARARASASYMPPGGPAKWGGRRSRAREPADTRAVLSCGRASIRPCVVRLPKWKQTREKKRVFFLIAWLWLDVVL